MKMKKIILTSIAVLGAIFCSGAVSAQETSTDYELVDSIVYKSAAVLDTTRVGKNILNELNVIQDNEISTAFTGQLERNKERSISGYRVRIFFDNSQTARVSASSILERFTAKYLGTPAYLAYVNPYFKVTVGDFRTKSDAMRFLTSIKSEYPSAFIVKENINYPVVDENNAYIIDTVQVLRRVAGPELTMTEE